MNNLRTVSDTKRDFYTYHTRPINSIYHKVVEELMVEMHLLAVNADFRYDPIYALGVVTAFNKFMQGYRPERDRDSIFAALCRSVGGEASKYQQDAKHLEALVKSGAGLMDSLAAINSGGELSTILSGIANNPKFKYSRLFGIGLFTLLELTDPEAAKDEKLYEQICTALHLPTEKLQKDLELYRSNLEKLSQMQLAIEDALNADRKKREQRAREKEAIASPADENKEVGE
ncbi:MAG: photosystem II biogenesis protein Psp29 [Cyanosarcina radialis HA8281-LM2]|nr:photosystem II biogenesis protein Psp29 [Cyanosarcina radialis HA8281-LM2]